MIFGLKWCPKCKERKPDSEFGKDKSRKDGLAYMCKECARQLSRQYYKENPEKYRQWQEQRRKNQPAAVYKIWNTITGQSYIGQTKILWIRWASHRHHLRRNKHDNPKLQKDYNKYGLDAFVFKIIKEFPSDTTSDVLLKEEEKMITEYNQRGESLYNIIRESEE